MENPDPLENRPSAIKAMSRRGGFRNVGDDVATPPPASTTSGTQTRRTGHPEECVVFRNALKMSSHYKLWIHVSCAIRG